MGRFVAARGLNPRVAVMIAPEIGEIAERVETAARRFAPPQKTWKSMGDPLVRKEHRKADRQAIPGNLRYEVDSPLYDREHYGAGPTQLLREPRDPNGTPGATYNCRCRSEIDPTAIANTIKAHPPVVGGTRVSADVTCDYNRAHEAEFGNDVDVGARFMRNGLDAAAASL